MHEPAVCLAAKPVTRLSLSRSLLSFSSLSGIITYVYLSLFADCAFVRRWTFCPAYLRAVDTPASLPTSTAGKRRRRCIYKRSYVRLATSRTSCWRMDVYIRSSMKVVCGGFWQS